MVTGYVLLTGMALQASAPSVQPFGASSLNYGMTCVGRPAAGSRFNIEVDVNDEGRQRAARVRSTSQSFPSGQFTPVLNFIYIYSGSPVSSPRYSEDFRLRRPEGDYRLSYDFELGVVTNGRLIFWRKSTRPGGAASISDRTQLATLTCATEQRRP